MSPTPPGADERGARAAIAVAALILAVGGWSVLREVVRYHRWRAQTASATVTIVAVGDVMVGRRVADAINRSGTGYPFARVTDSLRDADLAFGNLECVLSDRGAPMVKPAVLRGPLRVAPSLRSAGFDVLSLANNHALDFGRSALLDTMAGLRQAGVRTVGAGRSALEARAPLLLTRKGLRLALLAFNQFPPEGRVPVPDAPSVSFLDEAQAIPLVKAASQRAHAVLVSLHWGAEFDRIPSDSQRRFARSLVDNGATLILGHHPHVAQRVERYRNGLIAYSLGNFVFDDPRPRGSEGTLLRATLSRDRVVRWTALPVRIVDCQPQVQVRAQSGR